MYIKKKSVCECCCVLMCTCLINNQFYFQFFVLEREAGVFEYCIKALNLTKCGFGLFLSQTFLGWLPVVTMKLS